MKTAIIIPTYKRLWLIERVLRNLTRCAFPPDVEICVVENGSRDGVESLCRDFSVGDRVCYLHTPVPGRSKAVNLAIRAMDADFFIFFDDDVTFAEDMVEIYVDAARRHGQGHIFGGPLVPDAEMRCPSYLIPYLPRSATGWSLGDGEIEIPASQFEYFFGANWAVFKSDLMTSGLFSEDLGVGAAKNSPMGEETELQHRLINASVKAVYLPRATIHHLVPPECYTMKWAWRRTFREGVTDWKLVHRFEPMRRRIFGIPLWIIRAVAIQEFKVTLSYAPGFSIERRTEIKIREAYLAGLLHGAWADRTQAGPPIAAP
jgi:GT2 family glycosyltransferase